MRPAGNSSRPLFIGLLALLVWAPLPLGSNRIWAWSITVGWAIALLAGWLALYAAGRTTAPPVLRRARIALALGGGWLAFLMLQGLPLPPDLVALLSPKAAAIQAETRNALAGFTDAAPPTWATLSLDANASRNYLLRALGYASSFLLVLVLVDSRRRLELLLATLVLSGTFQALYGSFMALSGLDYGFFHKKPVGHGIATGTFINRNHLAGYLNLCLAAGMGLMIARLGGEPIHSLRQFLRSMAGLLLSSKTRLRIYLVIMVIGLVLTRSRMGNTAFFAATLIAGGIGLALMRNAPRSTVIFLASVIALDLLIVGAWFGVDQVAQRIEATRITSPSGDVLPDETRDEVDAYTLRYVRDYWLTGSGGGTYGVVFPAYSQRDVVGFYDHAHNDYLEFLAETGVLGFACGGGLVLATGIAALAALRRRHDPLLRGTAFAVIMAIAWAALHSTVDFNLQIPANAISFSVMLALAWVAMHLGRGNAASPAER